MTSERVSSGLYYHGTKEEVRLGDRVKIRLWFWRSTEGVVCCIPGISPKHRELESTGVARWAIRLPDGNLRVIGYYPQHAQPGQHISLLERGALFEPLDPKKQIDYSASPGEEDEE